MVNNRIYLSFERPERELVEAFRGLPVANIADEMNRLSCLDTGMRPYNERTLVGVALTVKAAANDNLMFHKAISLAKPGDIIVVDGEGSLAHALCGEMMFRAACNKGIAGFVVDGAIRDCASLAELDFSVYARGVQPKGPYKNGPGEINAPVSVGGIVVEPGDILIGDADGLVVIKPEDAQTVLARAREKYEAESAALAELKRPPKQETGSWTDPILHEKGVEYIAEWRKRS